MSEKVYSYNGKLYSNDYYSNLDKYEGSLDDLLYELSRKHPDIYREETITARYIDDEYFGTDEDKSDEEVIENILFQGYDEVIDLKEVKE